MRRGELLKPLVPDRWLQPDDLETVSVDDLGSFLVGIETETSRLEQQRAMVLSEFEDRNGHHVFGFPNPIAFLKSVCAMSGGRAKRLVKTARAARKHQATFAAWRFGQVSADQAQQLFNVSDQLPDKYEAAEPVLLDIVGDTPEDTRKILDYWRNSVDRTGVELDQETQLLRRHFDMTTKPDGMVAGNFLMPGLAAEYLRTAVNALIPPPTPADTRTATQRRCDALEELAAGFLETTNKRTTGGQKPHVNVHCDIDALKGEPGGLHETTAGQVLPVETIRQISCDASITRIVFGPKSEILDVGRKTRVIPPALRRAVIVRDRHCQHPGCRRDATWCDVHHLLHWADGGETTLTNLTLLCRYHHTLQHRNDTYQRRQIEEFYEEVPAQAGQRPTKG